MDTFLREIRHSQLWTHFLVLYSITLAILLFALFAFAQDGPSPPVIGSPANVNPMGGWPVTVERMVVALIAAIPPTLTALGALIMTIRNTRHISNLETKTDGITSAMVDQAKELGKFSAIAPVLTKQGDASAARDIARDVLAANSNRRRTSDRTRRSDRKPKRSRKAKRR